MRGLSLRPISTANTQNSIKRAILKPCMHHLAIVSTMNIYYTLVMYNKEEIENILIDNFKKDAFFSSHLPQQISSKTPFKDWVTFDSLSILSVIVFIEKEFNFKFEVSDVNEGTFYSLESLSEFIMAKQDSTSCAKPQ